MTRSTPQTLERVQFILLAGFTPLAFNGPMPANLVKARQGEVWVSQSDQHSTATVLLLVYIELMVTLPEQVGKVSGLLDWLNHYSAVHKIDLTAIRQDHPAIAGLALAEYFPNTYA